MELPLDAIESIAEKLPEAATIENIGIGWPDSLGESDRGEPLGGGRRLGRSSAWLGSVPGPPHPWSHYDSPVLRKTCAASFALQDAYLRDDPEDAMAASYGFIAIEPRIRTQLLEGDGFDGVAVLSDDGTFAFGISVLSSRGTEEGEQSLVRTIRIDGRLFPVVSTVGGVSYAGVPPSPNHVPNAGASACWAKFIGTPRTVGAWQQAIITAAHTVNVSMLGHAVPLIPSAHHSTPTTGRLVELAPVPIDAAVLAIQQADWPAGLTNIPTRDPAVKAIAPGSSLELVGRYTNATGRVLRVNATPGYWGSLVAERVVMDVTGVPGDSGGLVCDHPRTSCLGIYMGTIPSVRTGVRDGLAQGLWQASNFLEAELYL